MSLNRIPILVWGSVVTAFMVIFAMPAVTLSSTMLLLDRTAGTQFFNPAVGGDVLLYQHLFWWFGHPEVYIIFIPGAAQYEDALDLQVNKVLAGQSEPKAALDAAAQAWNQITDQLDRKKQTQLWRSALATYRKLGLVK